MDGSGGRVRGYWGFSGVGRLLTLAVAGCRYHRHHANQHYTEHIRINDRTGWKHGDKDDKDAKRRFPWVYILPSAMVPKFLVFANYDGSSSAPHGISHKSGHHQLAATRILHFRYFTFLPLEDPTIFFITETLLSSVWSGDKCYFSINKTLFSSLVE